MKLPSTLTLLAGILFFINSSAQTTLDKTDTIVAIFKTVIRANEKEKTIVQTDRKIYIAGEKIWFRAFVVNAATFKISRNSNNLFTDLVDDHDSVIATLVLNNQELNTSGAFTLPDSLKTGFYWLRSYTSGILAADTGSIFVQPIYILNKGLQDASAYNKQYTSMANKKNGNPVIQFFPERLTHIPNIISTGVLQINEANNNPMTVSGEVVNDNDSVITTFKTNQFGQARITFLNEAGEKYQAIFHVNSHDIKYEIPSNSHSKTQLSVANQNKQNIKAFVTLEEDLPLNFRTTVLGIHGDSLCYAAVGTGTYGITVPLNNFPGGINTLLLFDDQQHLLAERKIFISKDNYQLSVKANKKNYAARENAEIDIKVTGIDGKPIATALNIAVEDAWFAQLSDSDTLNNLPPNDAFYLNNWLSLYYTQYAPTDIDLLMVTAKPGYKSSTSEKINEQANDDNNEQLLNLIGKITDRKNTPQQDRVITVMSKNSNSFFVDVDTTKQDGSFKIVLPQIDSLTLSIQVADKHNVIRTDDKIIIDSFNFPRFATPISLKQPFLAANINTITLLRKYRVDTAITFQGKGWLKPVIVSTIKKEAPNYDESRRINGISQILTSDRFRYGGFNAVGYAVLTVPGVTMYNGDLTIFGPGVDFQGNIGRPLLVVDGVAMGSASLGYLNSLSPADIDFIEVLRGAEAGIYGVRGGNGVISVNTKNGSDKIEYTKTNFKIFSPLTYHKSPLFYVPDYSNATIKNNTSPDPRTTIYWNGNIITDAKGEATVNFYTADNASNYSVTVTGITAKGDLVYKRIFISRN